MNTMFARGRMIAVLVLVLAQGLRAESTGAAAPAPAAPASAPADSDAAERRYQEMLGRMQAAIEEIAQLYGNPLFLQVFTNDPPRADELKERLAAVRSRREAETLEARLKAERDALASDIALKTRESERLTARLARQRVALDALSLAVEQARHAVEDTAP